MFALLFAGSLSSTCDYTIDLTSSSDYKSQSISSGYGYCLRFTAPHGVFMMNLIDTAQAEIYYAYSSYSSYISSYTYYQMMYSASSSTSSPRAVSFGTYYGLIYVTSSSYTTIYYTYSYANSTCTEIAISSNPSKTYYFPSTTTSYASSSSTYCFIYMGYGTQSDYVYRYSGNSYDTMAYNYGYYDGYITSSMSFSSIGYPLQLIYKPYYSTSSSLYYATLSSYSSTYYDSIVDGTFTYATSISILYPTSSSTLSAGAIAGIVIGSVLGFFILAGIVLFAILYHYRHPRVNINVNETAIPASTKNDGFSKVPPSPAVMIPPPTPYGQYPAPPTVQFSMNAQPYVGIPPNQPYGTQAMIYAPMPPKYSGP